MERHLRFYTKKRINLRKGGESGLFKNRKRKRANEKNIADYLQGEGRDKRELLRSFLKEKEGKNEMS